ncbi:hypothetical protein AAFF_G00246750 [Aldrovandia affinis]|uniref:PiggyBac transposable element-derived protein 4 C-terminal zinc-ribbon domain-containing protein n=1 Tax=Aldrovandia affinis TaxID=143900 RepID=A0AAD7SU43_9TELE|nr:hypothetical protein AAFF_G00246750 [Aldrovandia affinis]
MAQQPNLMGGVDNTRWLFIKELAKKHVIPLMQRHMEGSSHLQKVITKAMERCGVMKESHATTTQPQGQSGQGQKSKRCQLCRSAKDRKVSCWCSQCNAPICRDHSDKLVVVFCNKCMD